MLASLTPCLRQRSATGTPASCSFKIPMICSSVKRLRFMLWSSLGPERTSNWIMPKGQGQRDPRPLFTPSGVLMGADDRTVDQRHRLRRACCQHLENLDPNTCLGPAVKAIIDRRVRAIAFRKISPGRACPQHIEDAVENPPVVDPTDTAWLIRQQGLDQSPFSIAQVKPRHRSEEHTSELQSPDH